MAKLDHRASRIASTEMPVLDLKSVLNRPTTLENLPERPPTHVRSLDATLSRSVLSGFISCNYSAKKPVPRLSDEFYSLAVPGISPAFLSQYLVDPNQLDAGRPSPPHSPAHTSTRSHCRFFSILFACSRISKNQHGDPRADSLHLPAPGPPPDMCSPSLDQYHQ